MGKIQQFFKKIIDRFRKKPIALPEAVDTRTKEPGPTKRDLREEVKFDPRNPEVCKGDKFFDSILRNLGVREEIINNPKFKHDFIFFINDLNTDCKINNPQEYVEIDSEHPTHEAIQQVIKLIKSHPIQSDEELSAGYEATHEKFLEGSTSLYGKIKYMIEIDSSTGNVRMKSVHDQIDGAPAPRHYISCATREYSLDQEGQVTAVYEGRIIGRKGKGEYEGYPRSLSVYSFDKSGKQASLESKWFKPIGDMRNTDDLAGSKIETDYSITRQEKGAKFELRSDERKRLSKIAKPGESVYTFSAPELLDAVSDVYKGKNVFRTQEELIARRNEEKEL